LKWAKDAEQAAKNKLFWSIRELRRIEIAGVTLPEKYKAWMDSHIIEFPKLVQMNRLDEDFLEAYKASWVSPNPDNRYDRLKGKSRLSSLNEALQSGRRSWDDDPSQRALDWIRAPGNCRQVIGDFESDSDGGASYSRVWEAFGWSHTSMISTGEVAAERDLLLECSRVLSLIARLPKTTIKQAIEGISHWLSSWESLVVVHHDGLSVWLKVWPLAVEATNNKKPSEEDAELSSAIRADHDEGPADLYTLNSPAGKLVGVFLAACPTVQPGDEPFNSDGLVRSMRNEIEAVLGTSGSIVKYRLIEHLPYFLAADKEWALTNLIPPLLNDADEARLLWRAVARQSLSFVVMEILGYAMVEHALDQNLSRDTRKSLVFRIIVDCLYAFRDQREPNVTHQRIQQMIRSLDDEIRAYAAEAIQRFVRDLCTQSTEKSVEASPENLFKMAAAPFLRKVWPQERSLATPGVSKALADLPSTAGDAFADAVDAIERFLVPFDCWSMLDYGLYGEEDGEPKLSIIDSHDKASAFLQLLGKTIGTADGSIIPFDLAGALEQIRRVDPRLADNHVFRRLAATARRSS
jgi:hypothetical protein